MALKNPNIKRANEEVEVTHDQVIELGKCAQDPVYFIQNFVKIQHPVKGAVHFDLYDYQIEMIELFNGHKDVIVLASRQVGKSVCSCAYILWYVCFNFDKTVLITSNKHTMAIEMVARIRFAYENLPMWLKPGVMDDGFNRLSLKFDNDSRIISSATTSDAGRGYSVSLLYSDEFAFVDPNVQEDFWGAVAPTLSTGGKSIITSTPNGDDDMYANLWKGACDNINGFKNLFVNWDAPPGRDEGFKDEMIGKIGIQRWRQEYCCEFISSENLLLDALVIPRLRKGVKDHIKEIRGIRFFKQPTSGTYIIGVDPSTGSGNDFSCIQVFKFPELEQVIEYTDDVVNSPDLYEVLKKIITLLEKAGGRGYYSVENNGVGEGILSCIMMDDHPPPVFDLVSEEGKNRYGITTTHRKKLQSCLNLKYLIERDQIIMYSSVLVNEFANFIRKGQSYQARGNSHDDCIMATTIVLRIIEEMAMYDQEAFDSLNAGRTEMKDSEWWGYDEPEGDEPMPMLF